MTFRLNLIQLPVIYNRMNKLFELLSVIFITSNCLSAEHEIKNMRHLMTSSPKQLHQAYTFVDYLHDEERAGQISSNSTDDLFKIQMNQSSPYYLEPSDPYQQLYQYALSIPDIKDVFISRRDLNADQYFKIISFMLNHSYFQKQLIRQLKKFGQNSWIQKMPPSAQVRFIKILGSLNLKDIENKQKWKQIEEQMKQDYDIGPEYEKYSKQNPSGNSLKQSYSIMLSNCL